MSSSKFRRTLSPRLIFLITTFLVVQSSAYIVPCRLASQDYAFKLVPKLHSCNKEFLLIASNQSLSCTELVRPLIISFISHEDFLLDGLPWNRFSSRCVMIAPDVGGEHSPVILIKKVYDSFRKYEGLYRKPTVIFLWPELFSRESYDVQLGKLETAFANVRFDVDTDIYTIFTSHHGTPGWFKFSIWEFYVIKNLPVHQMLQGHTSSGESSSAYSSESPLEFWIDETIVEENDNEINETSYHYDQLTNKVNRRDNFRQQPVVGSARDDPAEKDWLMIRKEGSKLFLCGGASAYLYWDLMKLLNFSEKIIIGDTPTTLPDGSLSGTTITHLNSGEADIALSQTLQVPFRAKEVTFLLPTYYGKIHVFFQQPPANSIRNIVTAPFPTTLWLTILCTWLLIIALIKVSAYINSCFEYEVHVHEIDGGCDHQFAAEVGMWAISANCQKSFSTKPSSSGMKMAFIVGSLCSVVSFNAYSAAIMSTFALQLIPIEKFTDLVNYKFVFTVYWRSEPFDEFLQSLIAMYKLNQKVEKVSAVDEITHLLNPQAPKAFLTYPDLFYQTAVTLNYTENFVCRTISKVAVSDVIYKSAMFLRKGSEFTELFNHKLIMVKENGLNYRYVRNVDRKNIFSCETLLNRSHKNGHMDPVKVSDVFTAFLVVVCGLLVSIALLVFEITVKRYSRKVERWYYIV